MVPQEARQAISRIVEKIITDYAPQKVILFGSYAYGDPNLDSDIDMLIIKETSERFLDRWMMIHRIITGLHRSLPVEPLVLTPQEVENRLAVGDQFIVEILEKGKVLYAERYPFVVDSGLTEDDVRESLEQVNGLAERFRVELAGE